MTRATAASALRGASAEALASLSERVGHTHTLADAAAMGEELFGLAGVLRSEAALRRVLSDASVEAEGKQALATRIFGEALRSDTLGVLTDAVARRWTSPADLPVAVERLGAVSVVRSAGAAGGRKISDELFAVRRLVIAHPELRSALSDGKRTTADRAGLLTGLLGDQVQPATLRLVEQAVRADGSVDNALDAYQQLAAEILGSVVAVVHTARPLGAAEADRLGQALGRAYDKTVQLHVVHDPELIGGLRVEIGDDVIDGTVSSRLDDARRRLAG